jgi:hypothetical protein
MLVSLAVTIAVALPWQLYILKRFPLEARYELAYNARHLREAVEGHKGDWNYYFDFFPIYFGDTVCWLIPIGIVLMLISKKLSRPISIALCSMFLIAVVFYSFIAQTKVYAYLVPVLPFGFIAIAFCADRVLGFLKRFRVVHVALTAIVFLVFCNVALQWGEIGRNHDKDRPDRVAMIKRTEVYRNLNQYLQPGTFVVVNVPEWEDIDLMFFNNNLEARAWSPNPDELAEYMRRGMKVAFFEGVRPIPDYIKNYTGAYVLPVQIH